MEVFVQRNGWGKRQKICVRKILLEMDKAKVIIVKGATARCVLSKIWCNII